MPGPSDSQRIALSTLELVLGLTRGLSGAVFSCETEARLGLITSRGLDQRIMDTVTRLWNERRAGLLAEPAYYAPRPESFLVLTCIDGQRPVCLLYADMAQPELRLGAEELAAFRKILLREIGDPVSARDRPEEVRAYLVHTSPEDIERDRLVLLLERHEWNVSRVARLAGMSRDTMYRRLRRYDLGRDVPSDTGSLPERAVREKG
jgi:DNA-binding phage protein